MACKKQTKTTKITDRKFDVMKEVMANQRKNEPEKQKKIYDSMKKVQVERKG